MLASLGIKGKSRNPLACLRNAGSYFAINYCRTGSAGRDGALLDFSKSRRFNLHIYRKGSISVYIQIHHTIIALQYDSAKWEPGKWEPSWNLPQFLPEKWELSYLGPGGLDSVFYLPCTV